MSWKFVFRCRFGKYRNIDFAIEACINAGYEFLLWNDTVYYIRGKALYFNTEIKVDDLF